MKVTRSRIYKLLNALGYKKEKANKETAFFIHTSKHINERMRQLYVEFKRDGSIDFIVKKSKQNRSDTRFTICQWWKWDEVSFEIGHKLREIEMITTEIAEERWMQGIRMELI